MDLLFWLMWYSLLVAGIVIIAQRNKIKELEKEKN